MSGVVNPAGRNYLERWALAMAEGDALFLSDGGNSDTLGQPLLREFLREYRCLPTLPFTARADASDPVTVRELKRGKDFLFYLVNCEPFPIKVELRIKTNGPVRRLSSGETMPVDKNTLHLELKAYQLLSFQSPPDTVIETVKNIVPEVELEKAKLRMQWLSQFAEDVRAKLAGDNLTPDQLQILENSVQQTRAAMEKGWLWRARVLMERQALLAIYQKCNRFPPYLRDNGTPVAPADALKAPDLLKRASTANGVRIENSETVSKEWAEDKVLATEQPSFSITVDTPVDGRYRITIGHAAGGDYGPVEIISGGKVIGVMGKGQSNLHGEATILMNLAALKRGKTTLEFRRQAGTRTAISFVHMAPVFDDILALRWSLIGPFINNGDAKVNIARAFPPEQQRNLTIEIPLENGKALRWKTPDKFADFVDLSSGNQPNPNSVGYAVTHIYAPSARTARLSYGMDYWIKIWLDGKLLKDYEPHSGGAPVKGQYVLDVELQAGWNELFVKVVSGSGGNGFWMAVSNPGDLRFSAKPPQKP
jgi:hypothetical protein